MASGTGFLGAGIIFREGFNVPRPQHHGDPLVLGLRRHARGRRRARLRRLVTGIVVFVSLALRPNVPRINRQPIAQTELVRHYAVTIVCRAEQEAHVRALMLQGFVANGLQRTELDSEDLPSSDRVQVTAEVNADRTSATALEQIVGRLSLEPAVTAARWRLATGEQAP